MPQLPARQGVAIPLEQGQSLQVINTHGKQVIDLWAFNPKDSHDYLSTSHTRAMLSSISLRKGNNLYSSRRKPIMTLVDDTTPALREFPEIKVRDDWVPDPLNLFMNVAVDHHGGIDIRNPTSDKGQYVILRATADLVVVMSACPQDMVNVNGEGPADCEYRVIERSR
ncbi:protein of unknown function DUF1989 [Fusarium oxysporum f. sp. vasinfectum]|nr:protein of unknown function DUF1989 [Fusarium oxysporum f. sp. vasinfectum]